MALRDEVAAGVARAVPLLGVSGTLASGALDRVVQAEALVETVAGQTLDLLSPQLSTSFWLSNALAARYRFQGSRPAPCPSCAAPSRARILRHGARNDVREVLVCNRCGIGLDRDVGGAIAGISIAPVGVARPGEELVVRLAVDAERAVRARIAVRLTMPGQESPESVEALPPLLLDPGRNEAEVRFRLPAATAPHRYYIKVLAAVADDLVFACRPFFVLPKVAR